MTCPGDRGLEGTTSLSPRGPWASGTQNRCSGVETAHGQLGLLAQAASQCQLPPEVTFLLQQSAPQPSASSYSAGPADAIAADTFEMRRSFVAALGLEWAFA